ncbi:MAG TPA: DUF5131 family protein [Phycisphaerae bacterium]|jgi:protein gp37|nr:DUF5131 family protein [Phycisphaerae bacterium]
MGQTTGIEWTHHTWSPWWGCTKVSDGCKNCYADSWSNRWGFKIWGPSAERRFFGDKHWNDPRRWDREAAAAGERRRVFPSMCDPFEGRDDLYEPLMRFCGLIEQTPNLDWLLLTKRPENIDRLLPMHWMRPGMFPRNIWLGTSFEDQKSLIDRLGHLCNCPAPVRFLSGEPLLAEADLIEAFRLVLSAACRLALICPPPTAKEITTETASQSISSVLHWMIVGGESGGLARPMDPAWAMKLRDQCRTAGIPFFFKQWGEWAPWDFDSWTPNELHEFRFGQGEESRGVFRVGKKLAGRQLDGRTWDEIPEVRS